MALNNKTQIDQRIATTFATVPAKYPPLPVDVLKRFPSLADWQSSQQRVLNRIQEALESVNSDFGLPLSAVKADQEVLAKTVDTNFGTLSARIDEETQILVDENGALAQRTTSLESKVDGVSGSPGLIARVTTVEQTFATKDYAETKKEEAIFSAKTYTDGQNQPITQAISSIQTNYATKLYADTTSEARKTEAITSAKTYTDGEITTVNGTISGIGSTISSIQTNYATKTYADNTSIAAKTEAIASSKTYTDGEIGTVNSSIATITSTYATKTYADNAAEAKKTEAISASNGYTDAEIVDEATARSTADGYLSGQRVIKVDAGGRVAGMAITAISDPTGWQTTNEVAFQTSAFKIYDGTSSIQVFDLSNNTLTLNANLVVNGTTLATMSKPLRYVGAFVTAPSAASYQDNSVYKNTTDGNSYVLQNGSWVLYLTKGQDGSSAKSVRLSATSQVFQIAKAGTTSPSTITITAVGQNLSGNPTDFSVTSGSATLTGTGTTRTLSSTSMTSDAVTVRVTWDSQVDEMTFVKVREGSDSINAFLSNEAHTAQSSYDGTVTVLDGATSDLIVYVGSVNDTANWSFSASAGLGITGSLGTGATKNRYTVTALAADSAYVDITATKGSESVTKRFSVAKSKAGQTGQPGDNAKLITLSASSQTFQINKAGANTPAAITLTATVQNLTGTPVFTTSPNVTLTGTGSTQSLSFSNMGNNDAVTVTVSLGGFSDSVTVVKVREGVDGNDAITAVLTNESHTLAAATDGTVSAGTLATAFTDVYVYKGITDDTTNWSFSASPSNCTGTFGSGATVNRYTLTSITADTATVVITATRSGYASISKTFSISKSKTGASGTNGTNGTNASQLTLISTAQTFQIAQGPSAANTPAWIRFTAQRQNLTDYPVWEVTSGTATFDPNELTAVTAWYNYRDAGNIRTGEYHTDETQPYGYAAGPGTIATYHWADADKNGRISLTELLDVITANNYSPKRSPVRVLYYAGMTTDNIALRATCGGLEDSISVVKVREGSNAVNVVLSNEAHTVPSATDGTSPVLTGASTNVTVYVGSSDDTSNWTISKADSTGVTSTLSGSTVTVTAFTQDSGYVDITVSKSGYTNVTKRFSLSKSKTGAKGDTGNNAKLVSLASSSQTFQINKAGTNSPASITFTATGQNLTGTPTFSVSSGTATLTAGGSASENVLTFANMTTDVVSVKVTWDTVSDVVSVAKIREGADGSAGADAIVALLTNEAHVVPANSAGTVSDYTGANTTIVIYKGITDDSANWSVAVSATNCTTSVSGKVVTVTSLTADVGYADITVSRTGYASITKRFTVSKSKAGTNGTNGDPGPGIVYRGTYDASKAYYHTATRRDVVSYSNAFYLVNNTGKNGLTTWGTPGSADWASFGATFSSVATGLLLAEDATITRTLTIGSDGTNNGLIKSANYNAGSAGWAIKNDGTVEFNSGTFRGSMDVGSGLNRTQIDTTGITVGNATIGTATFGAQTQNTVKVSYAVAGVGTAVSSITAGSVSSVIGVTYTPSSGSVSRSYLSSSEIYTTGYITAGNYVTADSYITAGSYITANGTITSNGAFATSGSSNLSLQTSGATRWYIGGSDGYLKMNGNYRIQNAYDSSWTVPLQAGTTGNTIQFRWINGELRVAVDFQDVGAVQFQ